MLSRRCGLLLPSFACDVVCLCMFVGRKHEPCKNGRTDRGAVRIVDSRKHVLGGSLIPSQEGTLLGP